MKKSIFKSAKVIALLGMLLIATQSCVVTSIYPIYTNDTQTYLKELNGTWEDDDVKVIIEPVFKSSLSDTVKASWGEKALPEHTYKIKYIADRDPFEEIHRTDKTISNGKIKIKGTYKIKHPADKDTTIFNGVLVKLDNQYYIDLILDNDYLNNRVKNLSIRGTILPVHLLGQIKLTDNKLSVCFLNNDNFDKKSREIIKVSIVKHDGQIVIASGTEELQKFTIKYAPKLFFKNEDNTLNLKRINN